VLNEDSADSFTGRRHGWLVSLGPQGCVEALEEQRRPTEAKSARIVDKGRYILLLNNFSASSPVA
jgi:hypothetical protein